MDLYKLENVSKAYGNFYALKNINLRIKKGEFVVVLGPSGSGKSTLLNLLFGITKPTNGNIWFNDKNIVTENKEFLRKMRLNDIGFINQDYNLIPTLNVFENIELGDNKKNSLKKEELINLLGLKKHLKKYPYQLSGGEKALVCILRALIKNPQVLIGDEITKPLDVNNSRHVLNILKKINQTYHTSIIIVTHDKFIASLASRVIYLKNGLINTN